MAFVNINSPHKLKECPYCKMEAKLFKIDVKSNLDCRAYSVYHIGCDNTKCRIKPTTNNYASIYNYNSDSMAINKACREWNSR